MASAVRRVILDASLHRIGAATFAAVFFSLAPNDMAQDDRGWMAVFLSLLLVGILAVMPSTKTAIWKMLPLSRADIGKVLWWRTIGLPILLSSIVTSATFGTTGWNSWLILITYQIIVIALAALTLLYASPWVAKPKNSILFEAPTKCVLHRLTSNRPSWIPQNVATFLVGVSPKWWNSINGVAMFSFSIACALGLYPLDFYIRRGDIVIPISSYNLRLVVALVSVSIAVLLYRHSEIWLWRLSVPSEWPVQVRNTKKEALSAGRLSGMWLLFPISKWLQGLVISGMIAAIVNITDGLPVPVGGVILVVSAMVTVACLNDTMYRSNLLIRSLPISTIRLIFTLQIIPMIPLFSLFFVLIVIMDFPFVESMPLIGALLCATAIIHLAMPLALTRWGAPGAAMIAGFLIFVGANVLRASVPTWAYINAPEFLGANWIAVYIGAITIGWVLIWWLLSNHGGEIKRTLVKTGDIYIYKKNVQNNK